MRSFAHHHWLPRWVFEVVHHARRESGHIVFGQRRGFVTCRIHHPSTPSQATRDLGVIDGLQIAACPDWKWCIFSRLLLAEDLQWFGAGSFQDQLDVAYGGYLQFCRANRIKQSQPPFTPKMVA